MIYMNSSAKLFVVLAITRFNCNRILIEKRQSLHIFLNGPKGSAFAEFALSERTAELRNYNRALPCKNKPARHQRRPSARRDIFLLIQPSTFCASAGN
jgi:hypothetical protein